MAELSEHQKNYDPYPDVAVIKNIAEAVHFYILLNFGVLCGALCYYLMRIAKMCYSDLLNSVMAPVAIINTPNTVRSMPTSILWEI